VLHDQRNDDVQSFYLTKAKYCLFTLNITAIPDNDLQRTLNNIVTKFSKRSWVNFMQYKFNEMSELRWIQFQDIISPMAISRYHDFAQLLIKKSEFTQWLKLTALRLTGKDLVYSHKQFVSQATDHRPHEHEHSQQLVTRSNGSHKDYVNRMDETDRVKINPGHHSNSIGEKTPVSSFIDNETVRERKDWEKPSSLKVGLLIYRYNAKSDSIDFLVTIDPYGAYCFIVSLYSFLFLVVYLYSLCCKPDGGEWKQLTRERRISCYKHFCSKC
jgi:hypothetical protein